jgi:hypothetical protein
LGATPYQREIIESTAKIKIAAIGRRAGKTTTQALALTKCSQDWPDRKSWYISKSYAKSIELKTAMEACPAYKALVKKIHSQFPPRHLFHNGHTLFFLSYDRPDNLLGSGLKLICPDEAAVMPEKVYYNVLAPMVADTDGQILLASNFGQGKNWFWKLAQTGLTAAGRADGIYTWDLPSSVGPLFQSEKGKARLEWYRRNLPPAVFESEFLNKPLVGENAVFRWLADRNEKGTPTTGPQPGRRYCMGLDIGRVIDPSFVVVMECLPVADKAHPPAGQVVFAEQFQHGMDYTAQARHAGQLSRTWNNATVVADSTGARGGAAPAPEPFFHLFQKEIPGIREYNWNQYTKFAIVNNLALEIEQGRVLIPPPDKFPMFGELVNQVKVFTYTETLSFVRYGAPKGEHDDGVAALAMADWGKVNGWAGGSGGQPAYKAFY